MHIATGLEVHFHPREQISVIVESSSSAGCEESGEIGLLTMLALRLLGSLGKSKAAEDLAQLLGRAEDFVVPLADGRTTGGVDLVKFPGRAGKRRFCAEFELRDKQMHFRLQPKGLGLFGKRLAHYGPLAVIALLRLLAMKRASDSVYLQRLAAAAAACGAAYRQEGGDLNQHQLGAAILFGQCCELASLDSPAVRNAPFAPAAGAALPEPRARKQPDKRAKPPNPRQRPERRWPRAALVLIGLAACTALLSPFYAWNAAPHADATQEQPDTAALQDSTQMRGGVTQSGGDNEARQSAGRLSKSASPKGRDERERGDSSPEVTRAVPRPVRKSSQHGHSRPSPEGPAATPRHAERQQGADRIFRRTLNQGMHHFWSRQYDNAMERLQSARELAPHDASPVYFLALVHARQGRTQLAEATLQAAARIEASHPLAEWGRLMERIQGRERLWLEQARAKSRFSRPGEGD